MRIGISGFGKYADTLHVDLPKFADWRAFTGVLTIGGVTYYYAQGDTLGVHYNTAVDPIDVAAQTLVLVADFLEVPREELEVVVGARCVHMTAEEKAAVTEELCRRMLTASEPPAVRLSRIEARGDTPAFYLKY